MIKAIVIGASYGGLEAIKFILNELPRKFKTPLIIVLHIGNNNINTFLSLLNRNENLTVKEAEEKEIIKAKTIYFAPPNYHLQVEDESSLSLSTAEKVNFSRPSIDVLFETAAWTFKQQLIGILLTGSNSDGAEGLKTIKKFGGTTIVENPETAYAKTMPQSAIKKSAPDFILNLEDIAKKMIELTSS
jgi:two-component system chemotaxis response regulator CheB